MTEPSSTSGTARHRSIRARAAVALALAAVLGGGLAAWRPWQRAPRDPLPEVDLSAVHPAVARTIQKALDDVAARPGSGAAWGRLGMVLRAHEFSAQADQALATAEKLEPRRALWPYVRGLGLAIDDPRSAVAAFERAAAADPRDPLPLLRKVELLIDLERLAEARETLHRLEAMAPGNARVLFNRGRLAAATHDWRECAAHLEASLAIQPGQRAVLELLVQARHRMGDRAEAARQQQRLAELPPGETLWPDPHAELVMSLRRDPVWRATTAWSALRQGRGDETLRILRELVDDDPADPRWPTELGRALIELGRADEAVKTLSEAAAAFPQAADLRLALGDALFLLGRWSDAAREYRAAVAARPDFALAWYNLGQAELRRNQPDAAREAFAAAVRHDPSLGEAHVNLAALLLDAGRPDDARPHLEAAQRMIPGDAQLQSLLRRVSPP